MDRISRLIEKELDKPHTYQQLTKQPFPYLEQSSRMQIFEFIYQLEKYNQDLKQSITHKYPGKSLNQIIEQHKAIQLAKSMLDIHKLTISDMEVELKDKMIEVESFQEKNEHLQNRSQQLEKEIKRLELELIEVQRQRRQLQFQLKIYKQRQEKENTSQIFQNLYKDVRNILEETL